MKQFMECWGSAIEKKQLESFEKSILQAIIGECALALENEQITIEKEKMRQFWQKMNSFCSNLPAGDFT